MVGNAFALANAVEYLNGAIRKIPWITPIDFRHTAMSMTQQ